MICIDDSATRFEVNPGNLEKIPCLCEKQKVSVVIVGKKQNRDKGESYNIRTVAHCSSKLFTPLP